MRAASLLCCAVIALPGVGRAATPVQVASPDGTIQVQLTAEGGALRYRILVDGSEVLAPSRLGIRSDGQELGEGVTLGTPTRRSVHGQYPFFGARSVAVIDANEAEVPATSQGGAYTVEVHVANDGVGVRLLLPAKQGRHIDADQSSWNLPGNPAIWATTLDPGYEHPYFTTTLKQIGTTPLNMPITAHVGSTWITMTEADLVDYGDLCLKPAANGELDGDLYADPQGWTTNTAVRQPWLVTVVARNLTTLVNTTLVQNLNPPPSAALAGAKWIVPGRSAWQWLAVGDPQQDDQKQWIDWTNQLGFKYYLIDEGWEQWNAPWPSITALSAYARSKHVRLWVWVHSKEVTDPAARRAFFQHAVKAGVAGIKIDFPPPTDRQESNWYVDSARDAAAMHLMLDFHGAVKPTGMERTWPNVLTREAIRGHEYQITRYHRRLDAEHDTILPFTRYIAGPADYTPTVFTPKELQGNTWGHELAQPILFTSPFLCFGGHPLSYLQNPARDVIMAIPSTWDEVRVLPGSEPGKLAAEARRKGDAWFIGVINGPDATTLDVPLSFLGPGTWHAVELFDVPDRPDAWDRRTVTVTAADHITVPMKARGGFVGWIRR